jgi:hypothetical protein
MKDSTVLIPGKKPQATLLSTMKDPTALIPDKKPQATLLSLVAVSNKLLLLCLLINEHF